MGVAFSVTREGENGVHSRIFYNWTNDNKYVRLSATPKNEKQLCNSKREKTIALIFD
jgi:hypothetical protein